MARLAMNSATNPYPGGTERLVTFHQDSDESLHLENHSRVISPATRENISLTHIFSERITVMKRFTAFLTAMFLSLSFASASLAQKEISITIGGEKKMYSYQNADCELTKQVVVGDDVYILGYADFSKKVSQDGSFLTRITHGRLNWETQFPGNPQAFDFIVAGGRIYVVGVCGVNGASAFLAEYSTGGDLLNWQVIGYGSSKSWGTSVTAGDSGDVFVSGLIDTSRSGRYVEHRFFVAKISCGNPGWIHISEKQSYEFALNVAVCFQTDEMHLLGVEDWNRDTNMFTFWTIPINQKTGKRVGEPIQHIVGGNPHAIRLESLFCK